MTATITPLATPDDPLVICGEHVTGRDPVPLTLGGTRLSPQTIDAHYWRPAPSAPHHFVMVLLFGYDTDRPHVHCTRAYWPDTLATAPHWVRQFVTTHHPQPSQSETAPWPQ